VDDQILNKYPGIVKRQAGALWRFPVMKPDNDHAFVTHLNIARRDYARRNAAMPSHGVVASRSKGFLHTGAGMAQAGRFEHSLAELK
jgi:hypothetical protein